MQGVVGCLQGGALSTSDVCGWRATPLPYPRISGNMWAARCSYIARLPDPASFEPVMERISASKWGKCPSWAVGRGRESAQHWILSHPSAVVSDVLPPISAAPGQPLYTWGYDFVPDTAAWAPAPAAFPRAGLAAHWFFGKDFSYTDVECSLESYRIQEYVDLYGPGVMGGLPCGSMYCQWFPAALLQLSQSHVPAHASGPVAQYLADMRAVGEASLASLGVKA